LDPIGLAEFCDLFCGDPASLDNDVEHMLAGLEPVAVGLSELSHGQPAGLDKLALRRRPEGSRVVGHLDRGRFGDLKGHSPQ
jgi:hypothetical protein